MPELLSKRKTKRIILWTEPEQAWVEIYEDLMTQDVMEISKLQDQSSANFEIIVKILADWNFTEDGKRSDINLANIGKIPMKYWFLVLQDASAFKELSKMTEKLTSSQKKI